MSAYLGIDAGNTAVKAVLFDARGRELASARRDTGGASPAPGMVERDLGQSAPRPRCPDRRGAAARRSARRRYRRHRHRRPWQRALSARRGRRAACRHPVARHPRRRAGGRLGARRHGGCRRGDLPAAAVARADTRAARLDGPGAAGGHGARRPCAALQGHRHPCPDRPDRLGCLGHGRRGPAAPAGEPL